MSLTLIASTFSCNCSASPRKNMQLVIIVRNKRATQQDTLCTLVKLLRVGLLSTDTQMWSFAIFFLTDPLKRCLKEVRSFIPATGTIRSTCPSSSSTANHRSHRNTNLVSAQCNQTSFYVQIFWHYNEFSV